MKELGNWRAVERFARQLANKAANHAWQLDLPALTPEQIVICDKLADQWFTQIERHYADKPSLEDRLKEAIISQFYRALMEAAVKEHGKHIQATADKAVRDAVAGGFARQLLHSVQAA